MVAKGARKSGSRLAGVSDPLSVAKLSLASGKRNAYITQSQPITSFPGLRTDYDRLSCALCLLELYSAVIPYEQEDPDAFESLMHSLAVLEVHAKPAVALVWSELVLMQAEGFLPQFAESAISGTPLGEAQAFVSPSAGGYLTPEEASNYPDRFLASAEVLLGLSKTALLPEPPANLKFAEEALVTLLSFWRHVAEAPLPATESVTKEFRYRNA